jgi:hypothetical protein
LTSGVPIKFSRQALYSADNEVFVPCSVVDADPVACDIKACHFNYNRQRLSQSFVVYKHEAASQNNYTSPVRKFVTINHR